MAKRSVPETPKPAVLSPDQMKAAIPKLQRRIADLEAVDVNSIQERGEPRFDALEQKIDTTLVEIFGNDTVEYKRFRIGMLGTASINYLYETPIHEVSGLQTGHRTSNLKSKDRN